MEEIYRPEPAPASRDRAETEDCGSALTRSTSNASSVTADDSRLRVHQNRNARVGHYTAWTDEKHNSYLDALEASFVKQLHNSLGYLSRASKENAVDTNPSCQLTVNAGYFADQFAVLQGGTWRKKVFERNQVLPYGAAGSYVATESSSIHHFTCSDKPSNIQSMDSKECIIFRSEGFSLRGKRIFTKGLTASEREFLCHQDHQDVVGSLAEGSDQNFVSEDQLEKATSLSSCKRLKKAAAYESPEDQIVPSGFIMKEIPTSRNPSSEGDKQVHLR